MREVSNTARKYELKFGVYLSLWDRHEPRYKSSAEYDNEMLNRQRRLPLRVEMKHVVMYNCARMETDP